MGADDPYRAGVRQGLPSFGAQSALRGMLFGFTPDLQALVGADLGPASEIQFARLVIASDEVLAFVLQVRNDFVGREEAVAVVEIDEIDQADDGKAAAFSFARWQRVGGVVVGNLHGGSVDELERDELGQLGAKHLG